MFSVEVRKRISDGSSMLAVTIARRNRTVPSSAATLG
jgi:hypothetical protein